MEQEAQHVLQKEVAGEIPAAGSTASSQKQKQELYSHQQQRVSDYTAGFSTDRSTEDLRKERLLHLY